MSNNTNSVSILSLLRPLVKQILEDMMEEERRGYLRELRDKVNKRDNLREQREKEIQRMIGGDFTPNTNLNNSYNPNEGLDELDINIKDIKANGYYKRKLNTIIGEIEDLKVPRTRDGKFHSVLIPYKKRNTFELDQI